VSAAHLRRAKRLSAARRQTRVVAFALEPPADPDPCHGRDARRLLQTAFDRVGRVERADVVDLAYEANANDAVIDAYLGRHHGAPAGAT